jgi:glycosyltransferase involved in cell wall biosynthesis
MGLVKVSCVMPIKRSDLVGRAIRSYQSQTYPETELVIYEASGNGGQVLNDGCTRATGDIICLFCDDDWSQPARIVYQVSALVGHQVTVFKNILYWDGERAYEMTFPSASVGYSLCFRREFWKRCPFNPDIRLGYCSQFVDEAYRAGVLNRVDGGDLIIAGKHSRQTSHGHTENIPVTDYRPPMEYFA